MNEALVSVKGFSYLPAFFPHPSVGTMSHCKAFNVEHYRLPCAHIIHLEDTVAWIAGLILQQAMPR